MEKVQAMFSNTLSEAFEALQEKEKCLTQEIEVLRQREREWREEREVLLQRDRWWAHQWQERERFILWSFNVRESNWSHAQFQHQRRWMNWKVQHDQQLQECDKALCECEKREDVLLKLLQQDKKHLVIQIETETENMEPFEEDKTQQAEDEMQFWQQAFHAIEREWSEFQLETKRSWDEWKSMHDQQIKDLEKAAEESEVRELMLLKLLTEEKRHLIIEIEKTVAETEKPQPVEEDKMLDQLIKDFEHAEESEAREQLLLKLLKEKRPLIIEMEKPVTEKDTQPSGEDSSYCEQNRPAPSAKSGDGDNIHIPITFGDFNEDPAAFLAPSTKPDAANDNHILVTFGDFPKEFKCLNNSSVTVLEEVDPNFPASNVQSETSSFTMRKMTTKKHVADVKDAHGIEKNVAQLLWSCSNEEEEEAVVEEKCVVSQCTVAVFHALYPIQEEEEPAEASDKEEAPVSGVCYFLHPDSERPWLDKCRYDATEIRFCSHQT